MTDDTSREAFLSRWSRRKRQGAEAEGPADHPPAPAAREAEEAMAEQAAPEIPEDLRDFDPEALDPETTDFSRFLREDVPEDIRRMALRHLWQADESLANLDGLNDYDEDFTPAGVAAAARDFIEKSARWLAEADEAGENGKSGKGVRPGQDGDPPLQASRAAAPDAAGTTATAEAPAEDAAETSPTTQSART